VSLIYLVTALPALKKEDVPKIDKVKFFSMAYNYLDKKELNDINLLLLKERVDYFINLMSTSMANNPSCDINKLSGLLKSKGSLHFTKLGDDFFPDWIYSALTPNQMIHLWYKEVFTKASSSFLRNWAGFSLSLDESITGLLSKKSSLSKEEFLFQMLDTFSPTSLIMRKNYNKEFLGLKNRFDWMTSLIKALSNESSEVLEKEINQIRLNKIDELKPMDCFSMDFLMAYYYELSISLREASFNKKSGEEVLNRILTSSLEAI
jgi:hypothetical protein